MKKALLIALVLAPSVALASFDRDLYYGLQNDAEVRELQEFLTEQGIYSGPVTGNFFSLTLKAVKSFQATNLISPTSGYFGPLTRAKANAVLSHQGVEQTTVLGEAGDPAPAPVVQPKTNDDVVRVLQEQVAALAEEKVFLQNQIALLTEQLSILRSIQTNTMPKPVPPPPPPPQEVDKSEIKVAVRGPFNHGLPGSPYGLYHLYAVVLDKAGKSVKGATVSLSAPDNHFTNQADIGPRETFNLSAEIEGWDANWTYIPTSPGSKTITLSSGDLSKTITIQVQ